MLRARFVHYRGRVSIQPSGDASWPAVLTWQAHNAPRMESVRVQLNGNRIKASGRIIGGACSEHPAFSASYDLVTDEAGITRRLSVRTALAAGERQMSISRDEEGHLDGRERRQSPALCVRWRTRCRRDPQPVLQHAAPSAASACRTTSKTPRSRSSTSISSTCASRVRPSPTALAPTESVCCPRCPARRCPSTPKVLSSTTRVWQLVSRFRISRLRSSRLRIAG